MKNLLLVSLFPLILFGCSNSEQRFVCGSDGLIITKNRAKYHMLDLEFCRKEGTVNIYAGNCKILENIQNSKQGDYYDYLYFDTVAQSILINAFTSKQCKKIN